ncbi:MAG: RNA polymerase sigma factor [Planctomycetota bacterium]
MQQDLELVRRVKEGQTDAYEPLVRRYECAARVTALRVLGDHHAAEDVVQEAFVVAHKHLGSLRDGSKFGPWLMRITRRRALRAARRRQPAVSIDATPEVADRLLDGRLRDGHEELIELISRLPLHERLVVTLHHLDGHRAAEIADITGRPVGTVTKQLSRAMRRLRRWAGTQDSTHERSR